jgi:hypothetical protein
MRALIEPREGGATRSRRANWTNSTDDISDFSDSNLGISDTPAVMVFPMAGGGRRKDMNWRDAESMSDAASRLLRVLDERAKKRKTLAGSDLDAGPDSNQPALSRVRAEKCGRDSERQHGSTALKLPGRQYTPPQGGGIGGDPVAEVGRSNGIGNAGGRAAELQRRANGCARPDAPGCAAGSTDRADTRPGGL